MKRIHLNETESTNSYLKEMLQAGIDLPDMLLVDADFQTGGRGQRGNSWESRRGENILLSVLCHPSEIEAKNQFVISQVVALAVWKTLDEWIEGVTIKWPNDIYWADRKICGILIECDLSGNRVENCIIGIGLNVNQTQFVSDAPNPVSLAQIVGFSVDREKLLDRLTEKLEEALDIKDMNDVRHEYKQHLYRKEGWFRFAEKEGEEFEAEMVDVENNGMLVLRRRNGEIKKYEFKEVKWILDI